MNVIISNLIWSSDWNGDEVGYPDINVVGLYGKEINDVHYDFYVDSETGEVLEIFTWDRDDLE